MSEAEKKQRRVPGYAIVLGILYLILQHGIYILGDAVARMLDITPYMPKIPFDDLIPIVSIFIIPYIWSYIYWAMGPMAVSLCEKQHFADYMAANLVGCVVGALILAFFPTYMDRVAEGLYEAAKDPTIFDRLRMYWYSLDVGSDIASNLLPSFHCLNSTLCFLGVAGRKEVPKWYRVYSLIMTLTIFASTVFVKQHYIMDVVTGAALGLIAFFLCKKFHWGRMFAPIQRAYGRWKAKRAAR